MKINRDQLVEMAVNAKIDHPKMKGYWGGHDGRARITLGTGGITYSHALGDPCMNIAGDHIEPGVSMANPDGAQNMAVETFSCVGNPVFVVSGSAKGARGFVTGTHGGVDHTMAYFDKKDLDKMDGSETFLIRTKGQGMKVEETPEVFWMNLDPDLLEAMDLKVDEDGTVEYPVAAILPAFLMGSGVGSSTMMNGDYDIMTQDKEANKRFGIDKLRFGDFVAVLDHDAEYGPHYKQGAVTIGVVVHSDSFTSGHGPGLTVLATSKAGKIRPMIDPVRSNLADYKEDLQRS